MIIIIITIRRRLYSWSRPSRQPGRKSRMQSETTIAGQVFKELDGWWNLIGFIMIPHSQVPQPTCFFMTSILPLLSWFWNLIIIVTIWPSDHCHSNHHDAGNVGFLSRWVLVSRERDQPGKRCLHCFRKVTCVYTCVGGWCGIIDDGGEMATLALVLVQRDSSEN